ncbi:hypothetical protein D9M69_676140 [compost metagenome]
MDACGDAGCGGRIRDRLQRGVELGLDGGVAREGAAYGDCEIGRTDVDAVEAGHGTDLLDVGQPVRRLDHGEHQRGGVGVGQ